MRLLPKVNLGRAFYLQQGFAPIALVVLLLFGVAAGTILVQNGVNFIPRAADEQEALRPVDPKKLEECDKKFEDEQKRIDCKSEICAADEVTYCDNRGDKPKAIRKTGGYYDPQHPLHDGSGCVFDFFEVSEKNDQCSKAESKNGDVVYTTKGEGDQIDSGRKNSQKDREKADKCASKVECRKNGDKLEAWRIISTFDEELNRCIGAKIENGRLVSDNSQEKFEFPDPSRDKECKSDKQVIEQSKSDSPKEDKDLASSSDRGRFGVDTDNQTKTLLSNFESTRARIQNNTTLNAEQKKKLLDKIDKADKALQNAKSYIDKCIQTGSQADCAAALSAQIYAVALSREALAEVVEAGIEGTKENPIRVKTDLQIGQNNNSQITAKPANGVPGFGRVFARAEGGKIYFEVRGDDGKFYLADSADLKSAGLTQGMSLEDYQKWLKGRLETVRQTTRTEPIITAPTTRQASMSVPDPATTRNSTDTKAPIIFRPAEKNLCAPEVCAESEVCLQRADLQTQEVIYKCFTSLVNKNALADPKNDWFYSTIYNVDAKECTVSCPSQSRCALAYFNGSQRFPDSNKIGQGEYSYICVSNDIPDRGKITPGKPLLPNGLYCEESSHCISNNCESVKKECVAAAPEIETRLLSSLTVIDLDSSKKTCGIEGTTCKFFTNNQKNDGVIFYTGKTNTEFLLISPNGNEVQITVGVVADKEIKSGAGLEQFVMTFQQKDFYSDFASKWRQYNNPPNNGKILLPKMLQP